MSERDWPPPPPGFERGTGEGAVLYARSGRLEAFRAAGLGAPEGWRRKLRDGGSGSGGRGRVARIEIPDVGRVVVKALRRGGLVAKLRPDTFRGPGRPLRNLLLPDLAVARGVATPRAAALALEGTGAGRVRGFLAVDEVEGAFDLRELWGRRHAGAGEAQCVASFVRTLHDAGLRHPDLNVGNLLLRGGESGSPEAFVVDLDGASLAPGPLPFRARVAALCRLERSYAKVFEPDDPMGPRGRDRWWELYAGSDESLAAGLRRIRWTGRISVGWHRIGWRLLGSKREKGDRWRGTASNS